MNSPGRLLTTDSMYNPIRNASARYSRHLLLTLKIRRLFVLWRIILKGKLNSKSLLKENFLNEKSNSRIWTLSSMIQRHFYHLDRSNDVIGHVLSLSPLWIVGTTVSVHSPLCRLSITIFYGYWKDSQQYGPKQWLRAQGWG